MKCIYCGNKAEHIVGGQSVCVKHIDYPDGDVPFFDDFRKYIRKMKLTRGKAQ